MIKIDEYVQAKVIFPEENEYIAIRNMYTHKAVTILPKIGDPINENTKRMALFDSIYLDNVEYFKTITEFYSIDLSFDDNILWKLAVLNNANKILVCLIQNGIDVNICNHYAVKASSYWGKYKILDILLNNGADASVDGNMPIQLAVNGGNVKIFEILLKYNADLHINNDYPLRGIMYRSMKYARYECLKFLLENGANIGALTNNDLFISLRWSFKIIKLLVQYGADYSFLNNISVSDPPKNYSDMLDLLEYKNLDSKTIALLFYGIREEYSPNMLEKINFLVSNVTNNKILIFLIKYIKEEDY